MIENKNTQNLRQVFIRVDKDEQTGLTNPIYIENRDATNVQVTREYNDVEEIDCRSPFDNMPATNRTAEKTEPTTPIFTENRNIVNSNEEGQLINSVTFDNRNVKNKHNEVQTEQPQQTTSLYASYPEIDYSSPFDKAPATNRTAEMYAPVETVGVCTAENANDIGRSEQNFASVTQSSNVASFTHFTTQLQNRQDLRGNVPVEMPPAKIIHTSNRKAMTPAEIAQIFIGRKCIVSHGESIYVFSGIFYQKLEQCDVHRTIYDTCRQEIDKIGQFKTLVDVYNFLLSEPRISLKEWPENQKYVAFLNALVDIDSGETMLHTPNILIDYCLQCKFTPDKLQTQYFDMFLESITGGDVELQNRIWEMLGYILVPDISGKVFFVLQGCPNSGKSVLASLIASFFSKEAVSAMDVHSLSESFAPIELEGKRVCVSPDLSAGLLDDASAAKLKQFSGNDLVSANKKHARYQNFKCRAKFLLCTNHALLLRKMDAAFYERCVAIPFEFQVDKGSADRNLLEKLKRERSAIATKALYAYARLRNNSYRFSGNYEINAAACLQNYTTPTDDVAPSIFNFVNRNFMKNDTEGFFVSELHAVYVKIYGEIPVNTFSAYFFKYAEQLFGASKTRKRKNPGDNATSYVSGISMKQLLM